MSIERIESKVDAIKDDISVINTTLAAQHEVLKVHIARTELLEIQVKHIEKRMTLAEGAFKFIAFAAVLAEVVIEIVKRS